MTDIQRARDIADRIIIMAEDLHGLIDDIESRQEGDRETIERLEGQVDELTIDLEEARGKDD